jgi:hypothetical protein
MVAPPPPLPNGNYAVDRVLQQMRVYSAAGGAQLMYFVKWIGYSLAEGTWEPASAFPAANPVHAIDIVPLQARVKRQGEVELAEHHEETVLRLQARLRQVLKDREGRNMLDRGAQAKVRINQLTVEYLFSKRLDMLARNKRKGQPSGVRSWTFRDMASFYTLVWPHVRLRQLGWQNARRPSGSVDHRLLVDDRIVLVCSARVLPSHALAGEIVYVISGDRCFLRLRRSIVRIAHQHLEMRQPLTVTFSAKTTKANFTMRGNPAKFDRAEWAVVEAALPPVVKW